VPRRVRLWLARLAAPAALLLAATVAVLAVRSALDSAEQARTTTSTTVATAPEPATTSKRPAPATTATTAAEPEFYTVESGDTLATIADQYGTTVEEILLLNPDVDPVELSIGQRIRVQ
jgi:LysM repeat protein